MHSNLKSRSVPCDGFQISKRGPNNFDITRICLAVFVYFGHYTWIFPHGPLPVGVVMFLAGEAGQRSVQAFFIISGFLMFQSFERSDWTAEFYEKRIRRIVPGYVTVILLSALIGFLLSNLTFSEYFSFDLAKYVFWNLLFLNFMHPTLPNLFNQSPTHYVNASLWTLKTEVAYYILFPLIYKIGRRIGFLTWFSILYVLSTIYYLFMVALAHKTGLNYYTILAAQLPGQLRFFVSGALFCSYYSGYTEIRPLLGLRVVMLGLIVIVLSGGLLTLYPGFLALCVLYFCLKGPRLGGWLKYGDLSYGIYIIHFPVLQAIRSLGGLDAQQDLLFIVTTILIFGLAAALWRFIEGPALRGRWLKKRAAVCIDRATA
jgi:peptidoglycan/LPS O-acetylase OafA/YrhL